MTQQQGLKEAPAAASLPATEKGTNASGDIAAIFQTCPACVCPHTVTTVGQLRATALCSVTENKQA